MNAIRAGARARTAAVALPLAAAALHLGPAATWLPPVRRMLAPRLHAAGRPGHVAVTFDDGPDPDSTPYFLSELDRLGVRATFFMLGEALLREPGVGREVAAAGHEVAVHGWAHRRPWRPAPLRDRAELRACAAAVEDVCGVRPRWYRPPYGILTAGRWAAAAGSGLRPVLWSAWGRDWEPGARWDAVSGTVLRGLVDGGTVLLHDTDRECAPGSWRVTLRALPVIVSACRDRGWSFGTLSEHLTAAPPGAPAR